MAKYILALDQGTTSSRAIVFDNTGAMRAKAQAEYAQIYPEDGWVEHDPLEIFSSQIAVASEAVARAGLNKKQLAAVVADIHQRSGQIAPCQPGMQSCCEIEFIQPGTVTIVGLTVFDA